MPQAAASLLLATLLLAAACGPSTPKGPELSFSTGRTRWTASDVRASVSEARGVDGVELSLQIDARNRETGEDLTFLAVVQQLPGDHPIRAFGHLAGFDSTQGYERLLPVSSACAAEDAAVLTLDQADPEKRLLSGTFLVNLCGIETDHTFTLGGGLFRQIPY